MWCARYFKWRRRGVHEFMASMGARPWGPPPKSRNDYLFHAPLGRHQAGRLAHLLGLVVGGDDRTVGQLRGGGIAKVAAPVSGELDLVLDVPCLAVVVADAGVFAEGPVANTVNRKQFVVREADIVR